jgi:hypothetical protein
MSESGRNNVVAIGADRLIKAPRIADGGSGPHDPFMEARVSRLEEDFKDFRAELRAFRSDLTGIRTDMGRVRADPGEMKGRLAHLPTTWVMLTGLIGSQVTLAGLVYCVARTLGKG